MRWAQGDAAGALSEVDLADKAAASVKDAHEADLLRLHVLWDRAYLLLDGARTPKERAAAEAVRKEFEALAAKAKNPAGVAVLRAWFASAGGHVAAARKAVAQAGLATTDDIQDVFVGGATLQRAGDPAGAEVFFRKVRESTKPYLMHALLLRRVPPPP